ncbi:DNA integrity scanning protein DisA nucleotide-binding domain protein [Desulfonema magnum]|uniref:Diadenylate cyclase n=1 Tax=Desulfonema magnum TaxID=45655 RepID=A0A975BWX2_9BACT|nr:DNA integrity scanning protein DisA nucleotide-binding domain protein [Desulfonema magnum]QTA93274.1 putative diadenylate cyclase [Desulfonema magnum]
MINKTLGRLRAFHIFEGLCEGLSLFSGPTRAALVYASRPDSPIKIYDPQELLRGHEPKLKELYLDSDKWRDFPNIRKVRCLKYPLSIEDSLELTGLISRGGRSPSVFYQMWFTEHHPDMCSIGPTERWLEQAIWLLSHEAATESTIHTGTSGCVLREYSTHAVRDYIVDELNIALGMDLQLRVYPVLDAVLGISKTLEEGAWPRGKMVCIESRALSKVNFLARFPDFEQPSLKNFKHVRKLLQAVEYSERKLISDGKFIIGIATGEMPKYRISADFRGGHGFLLLNGNQICSFFDGRFHSSTRQAKLVELEEILIESQLDTPDQHTLFKIISAIVHNAEDHKHGCTLVVDLNDPPIKISGQHLEAPLDLQQDCFLELTQSLSALDGSLHIGRDLKLWGFACILDGRAIPGEDRARGARFNSALRFTAEHHNIVVVVVSSDRPVSVIQEGVELTAQCEWKPVSARLPTPPTLEQWLEE